MSTIMHVQYVAMPSYKMTFIISDTTEAGIR
jgi:hypothetical protein